MDNGTSPNAKRLLWAGFFSIFAAGVGFAVRGGPVLAVWAREYGFTQKELGEISGGGLWGFGLVIILGCLIADRVGYGKLMIFAFIMHILSAVLQMATGPIYEQFGRDGVYMSLTAAMVMFSIANGTCEVVVNPMVAALFPREKTHYLNILHAGWPGGLIAGGVVSYLMNGGSVAGWEPFPEKVHWIIQMSMFLIPVAIYGLMMLGIHLPTSEASQAGVSYGEMLREFLAPVLLVFLIIHAMVGYVELGTDTWIQKITGTITRPEYGVLLFIYTNILMFTLRFFAGPIEHVISPMGLLFASAVIAATGLWFLSGAETVWYCVAALGIYGIGKTFFWPTMLAVVSERFPKGGALTLGMVGGMGMLSGGLLGSPGIGHKQDYFAAGEITQAAPDTHRRYATEGEKTFYGAFPVRALDGGKLGVLGDRGADLLRVVETDIKESAKGKAVEERARLAAWWNTEAKAYADADNKPLQDAVLYGSRQALKWTVPVPVTMAVLYLLLILYFKATGGYKRLEIIDPEKLSGGVEGPVR